MDFLILLLMNIVYGIKNGGYVFREGNILKILINAIYETLLSKNNVISIYKREQIKKNPFTNITINYWKSLKPFLVSYNKYGNPSINFSNAENIISKIKVK